MHKNAIDNPKLKAQSFKARFLEKGVVKYEDEMVLIKPENLMAIARDFKGAHVIIDHVDIGESNSDQIVGYITNVWFNEEDGWVWCDFTVNSEEAINLINSGYSVSCAYVPEYSNGGCYHNIPYDREIIGGKAIHLAIVENPRYEDAIILKNSIKKQVMNIFKFKKPVENSKVTEIDLENSMFEISEGEIVSAASMIEVCKNAKKNESEEDKEKVKVNASDEYEVDGKMVKVSELAEGYKLAEDYKAAAKKNAEDEEAKKENEAEEEKKKEEAKEAAKKNSSDVDALRNAKAKFESIEPVKNSRIVLDSQKFALGALAYGEPQRINK